MDHRLEFAVIESALEGHSTAEDNIGEGRGVAGANDQLGIDKRCFEFFMADVGHNSISKDHRVRMPQMRQSLVELRVYESTFKHFPPLPERQLPSGRRLGRHCAGLM